MLNSDLLDHLKGPFEEKVASRVASSLSDFEFIMSDQSNSQKGVVYHVREKVSMVTIALPREDTEGRPFRVTSEADTLRGIILDIMKEQAISLGMDYSVIE